VDEVRALREYSEGVRFKKPGYSADPATRRALVAALVERIARDENLDLESLAPDGGGAACFRVIDRRTEAALAEARRAEAEATRALRAFDEEHALELAAEEDEQRRQKVAEALASNDARRITEALGLGARALTTSDFANGATAPDGTRPSRTKILNAER
jgi:Mg/Co/Ni transporter MgtE